jgi:hypothetical protein
MKRLVALGTFALSACATVPAVSPGVQVAPDSRQACASNCQKLGLELAAVVLVRNSVGCVCAVPGTPPAARSGGPVAGGAVAVAGGVIVSDEEDAAQAQELPMQPPPVPVTIQ